MNTQDAPFAVQIELTEGCNLRCDFCGLQGIRKVGEKGFKFMEAETLSRLCREMDRLGWTSRIEFAMHGEPTMHAGFIEMVQLVRKMLPKASIMMTSNGGGLLGGAGPLGKLELLFDAGLNIFALDDYKSVKIGDKVRAAVDDANTDYPLSFLVQEYPQNKDASPHNRAKPKDHRLVFVQDISQAEEGTHASLNNHAGAAAPLVKEPLKARCAKPFRELAVRWDGNVAICCNDWRGVYKVGNICTMPLDKLWNDPKFQAARKFLYVGDRASLEPCRGCDALSYRVGLLPDKLGKEKMPKTTSADVDLLYQATKGKPFTAPVLRPWEQVVKLGR